MRLALIAYLFVALAAASNKRCKEQTPEVSKDMQTFLSAARHCLPLLCRLILDEGRFDEKSFRGLSQYPLVEAAKGGCPETCRVLLKNGFAPLYKSDRMEKSALDVAIDLGSLNVVEAFLGPAKPTILHVSQACALIKDEVEIPVRTTRRTIAILLAMVVMSGEAELSEYSLEFFRQSAIASGDADLVRSFEASISSYKTFSSSPKSKAPEVPTDADRKKRKHED